MQNHLQPIVESKTKHFGFDCMHCTDGVDIESFKKYYPNEKAPFIFYLFNKKPKSQIYVEEMLQLLAYDLCNMKR